jgi:hypothetical protein
MALYYFKCNKCNDLSKRFLKSIKLNEYRCLKCNELLVRAPKAPTTVVKETLDNGLMARAVERLSNADEIFKERAKNDTLERSGLLDDKA